MKQFIVTYLDLGGVIRNCEPRIYTSLESARKKCEEIPADAYPTVYQLGTMSWSF